MERELGRGQFGVVFLGRSCEDRESCFAVKRIAKNLLEKSAFFSVQLKRERAALRAVRSPFVVGLRETIETTSHVYLVLDFCDGGDLETLVNTQGPLSEAKALEFFAEMCVGYRALLEAGILHRDLKLANLFLRGGRVVIGDLGFARRGPTTTKLGTPACMAPEVLQGASYDARADLWAAGVALFTLLVGKAPFISRDLPELRRRVRTEAGTKLAMPPNVASAETRTLLTRMLEPEKELRLDWPQLFLTPLIRPLLARIELQQPSLPSKENAPPPNMSRPTQTGDLARQKRLQHEKKKINFSMMAARAARNISKNESLAQETHLRLVFVSVLLARKAWLRFIRLRERLRIEQERIFKLPKLTSLHDFAEEGSSHQEGRTLLSTTFAETASKALSSLEGDGKVYLTFLEQISAKAEAELSGSQFEPRLSRWDAQTAEPGPIEAEICAELGEIKTSVPLTDEMLLSLLQVYVSANEEAIFRTNRDGEFDWRAFQKQFIPDTARKTLFES